MHITSIIHQIENAAPPFMAASWDRSGVQVAAAREQADKIALALDPTPSTLAQALAWGAGLVLTHHPLAMAPTLPSRLDDYNRALSLLFTHDAWLVCAHTPLDCAPDGPAAWLADELGLGGRRIVEPSGSIPHVMAMAKEVTMDGFSPPTFPAGVEVDRFHFDRDALRHAPQGFICRKDQWPEVKASLNACPDVSSVACALTLSEPSTPYGYGLVGDLPAPLPFNDFVALLWGKINRNFMTFVGQTPPTVSRVAYCTGSGASAAAKAFALGADVFITGDVKHHQALEISPLGLTIDVGHHSLEEEMMRRFAQYLSTNLEQQGVTVRFFPSEDPLRAIFKP